MEKLVKYKVWEILIFRSNSSVFNFTKSYIKLISKTVQFTPNSQNYCFKIVFIFLSLRLVVNTIFVTGYFESPGILPDRGRGRTPDRLSFRIYLPFWDSSSLKVLLCDADDKRMSQPARVKINRTTSANNSRYIPYIYGCATQFLWLRFYLRDVCSKWKCSLLI